MQMRAARVRPLAGPGQIFVTQKAVSTLWRSGSAISIKHRNILIIFARSVARERRHNASFQMRATRSCIAVDVLTTARQTPLETRRSFFLKSCAETNESGTNSPGGAATEIVRLREHCSNSEPRAISRKRALVKSSGKWIPAPQTENLPRTGKIIDIFNSKIRKVVDNFNFEVWKVIHYLPLTRRVWKIPDNFDM